MRLLLALAIATGAQASYERVVGYQPGSQVRWAPLTGRLPTMLPPEPRSLAPSPTHT